MLLCKDLDVCKITKIIRKFFLLGIFCLSQKGDLLMRIKKAEKEDWQQLNVIYHAAFESNPCPENLMEEENGDTHPDLTPEAAMGKPPQDRSQFF